MTSIRTAIIVILVILGLLILTVYLSIAKAVDYKLTTSTLTTSGLYNPNVYVVGEDINQGAYLICTGTKPFSYLVSEYDQEKLEQYIEDGVEYSGYPHYGGTIKFGCQTLKLYDGMVIEGFNNDYNHVNYYLL